MVLGKDWDKAVLVELSPECRETQQIYCCGHNRRQCSSKTNVALE